MTPPRPRRAQRRLPVQGSCGRGNVVMWVRRIGPFWPNTVWYLQAARTTKRHLVCKPESQVPQITQITACEPFALDVDRPLLLSTGARKPTSRINLSALSR